MCCTTTVSSWTVDERCAVAFTREVLVNAAAAPDPIGATYPSADTETAETDRRRPERVAERSRTRDEYIEHVLAQIKAAAR
jgi:hypothetical protein